MARDIPLYFEKMNELVPRVASVLRVAERRQAAKNLMQEIADDASDSTLELTAAQIQALLNDQLAITTALQTVVNDAVAAMTP